MVHLSESPHIQWFDPYPRCRCGKKADGVLMGRRNESYGSHCKKCANVRIRESAKARRVMERLEQDPSQR